MSRCKTRIFFFKGEKSIGLVNVVEQAKERTKKVTSRQHCFLLRPPQYLDEYEIIEEVKNN